MDRLAFVALCLACGCENLQQALEDKAREEVAKISAKTDVGGDEGSSLLEEERLARKLDLYVACLDRSRARIHRSWTRYVDDVVPETGLPRRKGTQPYLHAIDKELEACREADERGKSLSPPLPELEEALASYLETSQRFAELSRALHAYYEGKAYEDDEWSQGKALAPEFDAAYEAWTASTQAFARVVSDTRDEVDARMLALVETREGKSLRWHAYHLAIEAKRVRTCLEGAQVLPKDCQSEFDALRAAHREFRAHHDDHASDAAKVFWMLAYETTADEYVQQVTELMRISPKAKPKVQQDAVESVLRIHDDLASDHANLKFEFP